MAILFQVLGQILLYSGISLALMAVIPLVWILYQAFRYRHRIQVAMGRETRMLKAEKGSFGSVRYQEHIVKTKDGEKIVLTELIVGPEKDQDDLQPIVCCHGSYCKRNFFCSPKGLGLGPYIAQYGKYRVFLLEFRGHGRSPKSNRFNLPRRFTPESMMKFDLPATHEYVKKLTGAKKVAYLGHSLGGLNITAAVANDYILNSEVYACLLFGSQYERRKSRTQYAIVRNIYHVIGHLFDCVPAPFMGFGPEVQSKEWGRQLLVWFVDQKFTDSKGKDMMGDQIKNITAPFYSFTSPGDKTDPADGVKLLFDRVSSKQKEYFLMGKGTGYSIDFNHIQLIVSKEAAKEIWPLTVKVLNRQQ